MPKSVIKALVGASNVLKMQTCVSCNHDVKAYIPVYLGRLTLLLRLVCYLKKMMLRHILIRYTLFNILIL
jgi:hypothetical protein